MLTAWYLIELTKLYIGTFHILNVRKEKPIKIVILLTLLPLLTADIWRIHHFGRITELSYDPFIIVGVVLLIMVYATGTFKSVLLLLVVYFFIQFVELLIAGVILFMSPIYIADVVTDPLYRMLLGANGLILILLVDFLMRKRDVKFHVELLGKRDMVLIILGLISFGFFVSAIQFLSDGSVALNQAHIVTASLSGVIVIGIVITFISRTSEVRLLRRMQQMQEKAVTEQHFYYGNMLERDRETRKFRHDFNVHMQTILHMAKEQPEIQKYVLDVAGNLKQIEDELETTTGSEIVDVIFHSLKVQYECERIAVEWTGNIPIQLKISPHDMTILFSNLLKNAFEAAVKCEDEKYIKVKIDIDRNIFFISMENSCVGDVVINKNRIQTCKRDKLNHGYGMRIIQETVNKYGGYLELFREENRFKVEILFKDIL